MRRKSHNRKRIIGIGAVAVVATVSATLIGARIWAGNNAMSGVDKVTENREDYRILEVVSAKEEGNMGFLAEGQEPYYLTDRLDLWLAEQKQNADFVNTKEARVKYVENLYTTLKDRTADVSQGESAVRYPLSYLPYQESYTPVDGYQELVFPQGMTEKVTVKAEFAPYEQLTPQQQEYGKFKAVLSDGGEIIDYVLVTEQSSAAPTAVTATETEGETGTEGGNETESETGTEGGNETEGETGTEGGNETEGETGTEGGNETEGETGNEGGNETEGETGTEGGNESEDGAGTGNENVTEQYYGIASYSFDQNASGYDAFVTVDRIYYTGGFTNNNWFKTYVLGLDETSDITVKVTSLTRVELEEQYQQGSNAYLEQFDMIVVDTDVTKEMAGIIKTLAAEIDKPLLVEKTYAEKYLGFVTDGFYLLENIFSYDEAILRGQGFLEELPPSAGECFDPVRERLDAEQIVNNKELKLTPAVVIQYLIQLHDMKSTGLMNIKANIRILEIEPSHAFDLMLTEDDVTTSKEDGKEFLEAYNIYATESGVSKLNRLKELLLKIGTVDSSVDYSSLYTFAQSVKGVSSSEFNSKEINVGQEFDLIYVGANTERMNVQGAETVYNDTKLNGMIYHITGDKNGSDTDRYGANDISENGMLHLLDAVQDHCPIIFDEKLFDGSEVVRTGVESNSQMYKLIETVKELPNVYTKAEFLTSNDSAVYANLNRPEFHVTDIWTEDGVEMIFSIELPGIPGTETYPLTLFADRDGDGRYHETEQVTDYTIVDTDGVALEQSSDGTYDLMAGKVYQLSWTADNAGSTRLPYRFICQLGEQVSVWEEGICTTEKTDGIEQIRVLQIKNESDPFELQYNRLFQLLCEMYQMDNYSIMTKTLTTAQYKEQFEAGAKIGQNLLDQYDVLVLTGLDMPDEGTEAGILGFGPLEAVRRYAQQGHSVLLLGDVQNDPIYDELTEMSEKSDFSLNDSKAEGNYYSLKTDTGIAIRDTDGTAIAENVRNGVVSSYPFVISGDIELTNCIYPQKAVDTTDSDCIVWYGMKDILDETGHSKSNAYEADYGNMRNNYLLYSYNNIMYYGINWADTNMDITMDNVNDTDSYKEWKLFVNALIACYNSGVKNPDVTILKGDTLSSGDKEVDYLLMDDQIEIEESIALGLTQQNMTLYFALEDYNITDGIKDITVRYYIGDEEGTDRIAGNVPVRALGEDGRLTTQLVVDGVPQGGDVSDSLMSGCVYQTSVPEIYNEVLSKGYADIYVVVSSTMEKDGETVHAVGYTKMTLTKVQLFNLD